MFFGGILLESGLKVTCFELVAMFFLLVGPLFYLLTRVDLGDCSGANWLFVVTASYDCLSRELPSDATLWLVVCIDALKFELAVSPIIRSSTRAFGYCLF